MTSSVNSKKEPNQALVGTSTPPSSTEGGRSAWGHYFSTFFSGLGDVIGKCSAAFGVFTGAYEVHGASQEYTQAVAIEDREGKRRAVEKLAAGSSFLGGASFYIAGKVCENYKTSVAHLVLGRISDGLFGLGSLVSMGIAISGMVRCHRFLKSLEEHSGNLSSIEQCRDALQFLRESCGFTEAGEFAREIKEKEFKRRASSEAYERVSRETSALLERLGSGVEQAIKETQALIAAIRKESHKKIALFIGAFLLAMVAFLAIFASIFLSLGSLPATLYAATTLLSLFSALVSYLHSKCKQDSPSEA